MDSEDDAGAMSEEEVIQATKKKDKKKKKGKQQQQLDSEDEDDMETDQPPVNNKKGGNTNNKAKPSFNSLMLDSDDGGGGSDNDDANSEDETPEPKQQVQQPQQGNKGKKNKKKKGKGNDAEEDEIANLLADIELKDTQEAEKKSGKKKKKKGKGDAEEDDVAEDGEAKADAADADSVNVEETMNGDVDSDDDQKQKKSNKKKEETNQEDDGEPRMKTAAEKKAEKKERDKKKKEADKAKKAKKKKDTSDAATPADEDAPAVVDASSPQQDADVSAATDDAVNETPVETTEGGEDKEDAAEEGEEGSGDEGDGDAAKKKKKKKKKKKGEEEDKKKIAKKPNKAAVAKMQEALEAVKREEERLKKEEEEKQRAFEEAEEKRLEKIRLEQERKDKKKLKEKERKERMKKEGKLLTPAQKEAKRKAEAMRDAMLQQSGQTVPEKVEGASLDTTAAGPPQKRRVYGKKKKNNQGQQPQQSPRDNNTDATVEAPAQPVEEIPVPEEPKEEPIAAEQEVEEKEEERPDSWDAEEPADSWDAEEDDKSAKKPEAKKDDTLAKLKKELEEAQAAVGEAEDDEDEDDDEEDDDDSDDDDDDDDESSSEDDSSSDEEENVHHKKLTPEQIKERAMDRIWERKQKHEANRSIDHLRAPVICVLGHVDTGKTKILDKLRRTNVQDGEAGGITQQIGATNIPKENIDTQCKMVRAYTNDFEMKLPGLLIIDTPGHESFANLRSRGSNLCDMAILVIDIMHGLEPQTLESIQLLKKRQTPFIVALNKIDRLFEWKKSPQTQVEDTVKKQKSKITRQEFDERVNNVVTQLAEQGLNAAVYYNNPDPKTYISLVPTSAHSGDGMGDLIYLICKLTQTRLAKKLAFSEELESTVMEVKEIHGLGMTIDVILVNGQLKEGDTIVTGGIEGAIVTQVRSVLTPQPMKELRVKAQYIHHKCLRAAQGAKLCAKDLDKVLAGSPLYVAHNEDEIEVLKEEVEEFVESSLKAIKVSDRGVYVQASTLGSLEALLEFLKTSKIPYCGVNIGPVHKKDVMKCSVMLEHEPMYSVILAFDVKVDRDAQEFADKEGVRIFTAEIIYHLFDAFTAYTEEYKAKKREEFKHLAVYPCKVKILTEHIFKTRDPIVVGVHVEAGTLRLGTPLLAQAETGMVHIGFCTGIEANNKPLEKAASGTDVCAKIEPSPGEAPKMLGRHFKETDTIISKVSRESIDVMKQYFREDMTKADWQLTIELKKLLEIM